MTRILVVDDQPHIVRVIKRMLSARGFSVETAANGLLALEAINKEWFDVIVTDYQMPKMDGIAMAEKVRDDNPEKEVFMILTTAIADESLQAWADAMPNCIYLEKPVSVRRLGDIIQNHVDNNDQSGDMIACS